MRVESSIDMSSVLKVQSSSYDTNIQEISKEKSKVVSNRQSPDGSNREFNENILEKAIEKANKELQGANRKIERTVHDKTNIVMYKIKDTETNEVIKEFPPEKIQDMIAKMWELAGLFVDERA